MNVRSDIEASERMLRREISTLKTSLTEKSDGMDRLVITHNKMIDERKSLVSSENHANGDASCYNKSCYHKILIDRKSRIRVYEIELQLIKLSCYL